MIAGGLAALLLAASAPARVAVVCAGRPAADCGALESSLRRELARPPALPLIPPADLSRALAVPAPPDLDAADAQDARARGLLDEGERLTNDGSFAPADEKLSEADRIQAALPFVSPGRVRCFLLRAALESARGRRDAARDQVAAALAIDPTARADAYPPAVQSLVTSLRAALPASKTLTLAVEPAGVDVKVDGRPASGPIAVVPGSHQIVARGPGLAPVVRLVDVSADAKLSLSLPVAVPAPLAGAIGGWLAAGARADAPPPELAAIASKAGADAIVVLVADGAGERAVVFRGTKARATAARPLSGDGAVPAALVSDVRPMISEGPATALATPTVAPTATPFAVAVTTPVPARTPPARAGGKPFARRPAVWAIAAGVLLAGGAAAAAASSGSQPKDHVANQTDIVWPQ